MKQRRKFILFYLSIICLFSCTAPYPNTILRVENIIKEYPDSALTILDSLSESITKESQSARMYYYLLLTEARDRCYVPHTSDSLMLSVTDYYERENDKDKLIKSYYYTGRVYLDLHEGPTALSYFHKALISLQIARTTLYWGEYTAKWELYLPMKVSQRKYYKLIETLITTYN